VSQFNIESLEHAPDHGGTDGSGLGGAEMFLDYDPILPCWPPEAGWVALPGVWSDRHAAEVERLPGEGSAQG
jgi:hypothetical protein